MGFPSPHNRWRNTQRGKCTRQMSHHQVLFRKQSVRSSMAPHNYSEVEDEDQGVSQSRNEQQTNTTLKESENGCGPVRSNEELATFDDLRNFFKSRIDSCSPSPVSVGLSRSRALEASRVRQRFGQGETIPNIDAEPNNKHLEQEIPEAISSSHFPPKGSNVLEEGADMRDHQRGFFGTKPNGKVAFEAFQGQQVPHSTIESSENLATSSKEEGADDRRAMTTGLTAYRKRRHFVPKFSSTSPPTNSRLSGSPIVRCPENNQNSHVEESAEALDTAEYFDLSPFPNGHEDEAMASMSSFGDASSGRRNSTRHVSFKGYEIHYAEPNEIEPSSPLGSLPPTVILVRQREMIGDQTGLSLAANEELSTSSSNGGKYHGDLNMRNFEWEFFSPSDELELDDLDLHAEKKKSETSEGSPSKISEYFETSRFCNRNQDSKALETIDFDDNCFGRHTSIRRVSFQDDVQDEGPDETKYSSSVRLRSLPPTYKRGRRNELISDQTGPPRAANQQPLTSPSTIGQYQSDSQEWNTELQSSSPTPDGPEPDKLILDAENSKSEPASFSFHSLKALFESHSAVTLKSELQGNDIPPKDDIVKHGESSTIDSIRTSTRTSMDRCSAGQSKMSTPSQGKNSKEDILGCQEHLLQEHTCSQIKLQLSKSCLKGMASQTHEKSQKPPLLLKGKQNKQNGLSPELQSNGGVSKRWLSSNRKSNEISPRIQSTSQDPIEPSVEPHPQQKKEQSGIQDPIFPSLAARRTFFQSVNPVNGCHSSATKANSEPFEFNDRTVHDENSTRLSDGFVRLHGVADKTVKWKPLNQGKSIEDVDDTLQLTTSGTVADSWTETSDDKLPLNHDNKRSQNALPIEVKRIGSLSKRSEHGAAVEVPVQGRKLGFMQPNDVNDGTTTRKETGWRSSARCKMRIDSGETGGIWDVGHQVGNCNAKSSAGLAAETVKNIDIQRAPIESSSSTSNGLNVPLVAQKKDQTVTFATSFPSVQERRTLFLTGSVRSGAPRASDPMNESIVSSTNSTSSASALRSNSNKCFPPRKVSWRIQSTDDIGKASQYEEKVNVQTEKSLNRHEATHEAAETQNDLPSMHMRSIHANKMSDKTQIHQPSHSRPSKLHEDRFKLAGQSTLSRISQSPKNFDLPTPEFQATEETTVPAKAVEFMNFPLRSVAHKHSHGLPAPQTDEHQNDVSNEYDDDVRDSYTQSYRAMPATANKMSDMTQIHQPFHSRPSKLHEDRFKLAGQSTLSRISQSPKNFDPPTPALQACGETTVPAKSVEFKKFSLKKLRSVTHKHSHGLPAPRAEDHRDDVPTLSNPFEDDVRDNVIPDYHQTLAIRRQSEGILDIRSRSPLADAVSHYYEHSERKHSSPFTVHHQLRSNGIDERLSLPYLPSPNTEHLHQRKTTKSSTYLPPRSDHRPPTTKFFPTGKSWTPHVSTHQNKPFYSFSTDGFSDHFDDHHQDSERPSLLTKEAEKVEPGPNRRPPRPTSSLSLLKTTSSQDSVQQMTTFKRSKWQVPASPLQSRRGFSPQSSPVRTSSATDLRCF